MYLSSVARRTRRGIVALAFSLAAVSLTFPGTAYARHDGAAIALGVRGGALAGAAISAGAAPGYYAEPPAYYYYPYAPPAYAVAPPPPYSYTPPVATYYAPVPYYGPQYYGRILRQRRLSMGNQ